MGSSGSFVGHRFGATHPPGYWYHAWPAPEEIILALHDPDRKAPIPRSLSGLYAPDAADMDILIRDPRWAIWIFNPSLDMLTPPGGVNLRHWTNMCLTPLHAPCMSAIRALGPAMVQRIRHGEVATSHRTRYVSHRAKEKPHVQSQRDLPPWALHG